jgi:hypothetical protein
MCLPVFKLVDIFAHRFTGSNCAWSDIIFIQSFVQKHTRSITTIYWIIVETEGLAYSTTLKSFQIYYHCPFTFSRRFCRLHGAPIKAVWLAPWRPDTSPIQTPAPFLSPVHKLLRLPVRPICLLLRLHDIHDSTHTCQPSLNCHDEMEQGNVR